MPVGGNVNWYSHSEKVKNRIPYDPAIALLGIYPKNTQKILIQRDTCSIIYDSQIMETVQVSNDSWMDEEDVVCIHNGILLSHKKEWNLDICNNMDGAREYYVKWNKSEKDKHHMTSLICEI